jgi:hypothetical protein
LEKFTSKKKSRKTLTNSFYLDYKSKKLENGENPLVIRICKDGKKKYLSLGLSINPIFWDFTEIEQVDFGNSFQTADANF